MTRHLFTFTSIAFLAVSVFAKSADQPNIILMMTDDQGYGDFGIMGNPVLDTPQLDQLARESASMTDFYVSPVCSPTRANLMTGRYNYRTRVVDTYKGRSMMEPEEYTIAEALSDSGYATGIFGKWHLGDNYPLRPSDQGFQEAYVHFGGGLGQPSEPIENERRYTNPILFHNNQKMETRGFCTDLYFEAAIDFIEKSLDEEKPFFAYIATNAPHSPYHDVPEALYRKYKGRDLSSVMLDDKVSEDDVARIFAMVENIDHNVGRLMDRIERRDIAENTIVVYLNDNGPNSRRFVGPFRGRKNEIQEGGIRSPLWFKWPARLDSSMKSDRISAHYDLMPTLLAAAGASVPNSVKLDGRNLLPLWEEETPDWPERHILIQAHRGNEPEAEHNMMIRSQQWKLVRPTGFHVESADPQIKLELYDMQKDPGESLNLAAEKPQVVKELLQAYHNWFDNVSHTRPDNYAPPRMRIGKDGNQRLVLNGQDRRVTLEGYEWALQIDDKAKYDIEVQYAIASPETSLQLELGDQKRDLQVPPGSKSLSLKGIMLDKGDLNLKMKLPKGHSRKELPYFIIMTKK